MEALKKYQEIFHEQFDALRFDQKKPSELYGPIDYLLQLGGKRLRPLVSLMACDIFGGTIQKAVKPSIAIELFHNFTLMHDDIMDSAPLRRGRTTVHEKYDVNTAILSGDALLIQSYQFFEDLEPHLFKKVISLFSATAAKLCEGQQYDMNFMQQSEVDLDEYLDMIKKKTGVLTAAAFKIGAIIAQASPEDADRIYQFGENLGIAFQLKDDLLDVFGEKSAVGKKQAGDIFENKKTILFIKALEKGNEQQIKELKYWYSITAENIDKIYAVERIFKQLKVDLLVSEMIDEYTQKAQNFIEQIEGHKISKDILYEFSDRLISRRY